MDERGLVLTERRGRSPQVDVARMAGRLGGAPADLVGGGAGDRGHEERVRRVGVLDRTSVAGEHLEEAFDVLGLAHGVDRAGQHLPDQLGLVDEGVVDEPGVAGEPLVEPEPASGRAGRGRRDRGLRPWRAGPRACGRGGTGPARSCPGARRRCESWPGRARRRAQPRRSAPASLAAGRPTRRFAAVRDVPLSDTIFRT